MHRIDVKSRPGAFHRHATDAPSWATYSTPPPSSFRSSPSQTSAPCSASTRARLRLYSIAHIFCLLLQAQCLPSGTPWIHMDMDFARRCKDHTLPGV